ncbi:exported hypothetical protein [Frankia sp. AiPs1]
MLSARRSAVPAARPARPAHRATGHPDRARTDQTGPGPVPHTDTPATPDNITPTPPPTPTRPQPSRNATATIKSALSASGLNDYSHWPRAHPVSDARARLRLQWHANVPFTFRVQVSHRA